MNIIRSIFVVVCILLSLLVRGQTAQWAVKPKYKEMTPFSESLYKIKTYEGMGVINQKGELLVSADSITYITNGYALALKANNDKYMVISIISKDGAVKKISEELYVGDYPFFSEDKCAVCDKKGRYGFINPLGTLVIPCSYIAVHPFREGLASVCKAKGGLLGFVSKTLDTKQPVGPSIYIDSKNIPIKLQAEIGKPILATSFKNGQALVQNQENKFFTIDVHGKILKIDTEVKLEFDNYFSLGIDENNLQINQPYRPQYSSSFKIYTSDDFIGYKYNNNVVLPTQFEKAGLFADGNAIVCKDGAYGLIHLVNSNISCKVTGKKDRIIASVTLPTEWDNKTASVILVSDSERKEFELIGGSGTRELDVEYTSTIDADVYELESDGLILWRNTENDAKVIESNSVTSEKSNTKKGRRKINSKSSGHGKTPKMKINGFVL